MRQPVRETIFSEDRKYRYTLWREWDVDSLTGCADDSPNSDMFVQFIGLNPSTADENKNDPTVRRCIQFAKDWGYGAMCMTNLFAFRATDPKEMKKQTFPVDQFSCDESKWILSNFDYISHVGFSAALVIAAWGKDGNHLRQGDKMRTFLNGAQIKLHHLGLNQDGTPKHPLYLKKTTQPIPYP